jgi:hypothetical protein
MAIDVWKVYFKMMIYFINISKTLNQRSFDFDFFQKNRIIIKKNPNQEFFKLFLIFNLNIK